MYLTVTVSIKDITCKALGTQQLVPLNHYRKKWEIPLLQFLRLDGATVAQQKSQLKAEGRIPVTPQGPLVLPVYWIINPKGWLLRDKGPKLPLWELDYAEQRGHALSYMTFWDQAFCSGVFLLSLLKRHVICGPDNSLG